MEEQSELDPTARIELVPAATRMLGPDLFVNAGGATSSVKCLTGSGPDLWWDFGRGLSIAEVAARHAVRTDVPAAELEAHVLEFASVLVEAELAVVAW
jgi:hypothetical protein